jgi:hypothetical protein
VFLAECDAHNAAQRAAEVQLAVQALQFEPLPGVYTPLGISIGHAAYPDKSARKNPFRSTAAPASAGVLTAC